MKNRTISTGRDEQRALLNLSPFEVKDKLIALAAESARQENALMLNAGRGNPNWICTTPREAFGTLLRFGIEQTRRGIDLPDFGRIPAKGGMGQRFEEFLRTNSDAPGAKLLREGFSYGVKSLGFDPDEFAFELAEGVVGWMYPVPDRMLRCTERIVHEYLSRELCAGAMPPGRFDLFAVEGGTAAICYIFDSLIENGLLHPGDTIAMGVPTFTPYIEMPHLDRYGFKVVNIDAGRQLDPDGYHTWQYADDEIDKLADPRIKAFFLVNPSNPPSYAMHADSMARLATLVRKQRQDLIVITDDVYCTFVPGFRSLMAELPQNTIGVYSYSKHCGCTGWRLGVIAVHEDNIYDRRIADLPETEKARLDRRYSSISLTPSSIKFIDRMVADSRQVALNHTAGLSLPQQIQMALFSLFALLDTADSYRTLCRLIVRRRYEALWEGLELSPPPAQDRAFYYTELDLLAWAEKVHGPQFVAYLKKNYECTDILFRLAELSGVVLMHGGGFGGPEWSVRVSLANLPEETYPKIGAYLREAAEGYVKEWKASPGS